MAAPGLPQPSGATARTSGGALRTGVCAYHGYIVTTTTATGAINVYDSTGAFGKQIDSIPATTAAGQRGVLAQPVPCATGIYIDFAGGATGTVLFLHD